MSKSKTESSDKRVFVHTFGCQMNEYDTTKVYAQLAKDGYAQTSEAAEADLILLNTCSIRDKAEQKMHSALGEYRRMKRQGQSVKIGVMGCVAQQEGETLTNRYNDIDLVFGPDGVPNVRNLVSSVMEEKKRKVVDTQFLDLDTYPFVTDVDPRASESVGAFVTIQKGCDNRCTFCIVPTTRGDEASRPSRQIVREVKMLVDCGVKEITLIGQNVNSYGLKVPEERNFAQLLYAVSDVPGVERIRYTTSHPRDMGPDVIQAYKDLPKLTSHLHLPVQSGSDAVLRRMKRFYTREHFLSVVAQLRDARPDIALTTDMIIGFPGETDEDFEQTMSLLEEVGFVGAFSFKYSPRPGTPALRLMKDAVDPTVASARLTRFQTRQNELQKEFVAGHLGQTIQVLVEGPSRYDEGFVAGRGSNHLMVNFKGGPDLVGQLVDVRVTEAFSHTARGERV